MLTRSIRDRPTCERRPVGSAHAPVSQSVEEAVLKTVQCGFEPHPGHRVEIPLQLGGVVSTRVSSCGDHHFIGGPCDARPRSVVPTAGARNKPLCFRGLPMSPVVADVKAQVSSTYGTGVPYWSRVLARLLLAPSVHAILLFRLAAYIARTPFRPLAFLLRSAGVVWAGTEIHPDARIGPGLFLLHSTGVVIGGGARLGSDCRISQGVTIGTLDRGSRDKGWGSPTIGDRVVIGANAVILGPCCIGDDAVVGANSVVTHDVPPAVVVAGSPARVIRARND